MRLACTRDNNIEVAILDLNPLRRCFVVVGRDALDLPGILEGLCTPAKIKMSEFLAAGSLTRNNRANVITKLSDWQHLLLSRLAPEIRHTSFDEISRVVERTRWSLLPDLYQLRNVKELIGLCILSGTGFRK